MMPDLLKGSAPQEQNVNGASQQSRQSERSALGFPLQYREVNGFLFRCFDSFSDSHFAPQCAS
jgi:hypothetical protein